MLDFSDLGRIVVIIPTFNERENLPVIVERVRASVPEAHILVADDNSPDGTGEIADGLAATDANVHVMHRLGKEGLGAAYLAQYGRKHVGMSSASFCRLLQDAAARQQGIARV